jgi:hypothetical protein
MAWSSHSVHSRVPLLISVHLVEFYLPCFTLNIAAAQKLYTLTGIQTSIGPRPVIGLNSLW